MKKLFVVGLLGLMGLMGNMLHAQTDWKKVQKLLDDGSYKTAYGEAEKVYKKTQNSSELLTAAWYMMKAATWYQEDAYDSSVARYRAILPRLEAPERAVCYALLEEADSALLDEELLKQTPAERIRQFCYGTDGKGLIVTPTVFDVVVHQLLDGTRGRWYREETEALLQKLIDFHSGDGDDIRIWLDVMMLNTLSSKANLANPEQLYRSYIEKYCASACVRKNQFYYRMALFLDGRGRHEEALRYCDTAVAIAPKSEGGSNASNLRNKILQTEIKISSYASNDLALPGRSSLHRLQYRNASRLYFALAPYHEEKRGHYDLSAIFRRWEMEVDTGDRYNLRSVLFEVPPLEPGRWMLVVSSDEKFDKEDALLEIKCTDMRILKTMEESLFQLINAVSGEPIVGQLVELYTKSLNKNDYRKVASVVTDSDGRFRFEDGSIENFWVKIVRDGYEYYDDFWSNRKRGETKMMGNINLMSDRPVYRPGDTVHVAAVLSVGNGLVGHTLPGEKVAFGLFDPNYELQDSLITLTDDFGTASATFVIPKDKLAGYWKVRAARWKGETGKGKVESGEWEDDDEDLLDEEVIVYDDDYLDEIFDDAYYGSNGILNIIVEEYKQPKFMVTLAASNTQTIKQSNNQTLAFGTPYTLYGLAQAYSGAKVGGAKVHYTVTRHTTYFRRYSWYDAPITEMVDDSTVTAADGTFEITFTPQPDSSVELSHKPNFRYEIYAEVTDLNGETHYATSSVTVGYHNTLLSLSGLSGTLVSSLEEVYVSLKDINERPLEGDVTIALSRLHRPDTARLLPRIMEEGGYYNSLSRERFRELFPTYFYSKEEEGMDSWKSDWDWSAVEHVSAEEMLHKVQLPALKSGYYRVVASCGDEADTHYVLLTLPDDRRCQTRQLLWADIQFDPKSQSGQTALPGERITLRYASAFEDVRFFYLLAGPDGQERDSRWLPAGPRIKSLSIPIDSSMLGGITIQIFAVKDGVVQWCDKSVDVPFRHKQLRVDIATFRDKLQPGEEEEWTIKVTGLQGERITGKPSYSASLIMTMFDDALSSYSYRSHWGLAYPWRHSRSYSSNWLSRYSYTQSYYFPFERQSYRDPAVTCWRIEALRATRFAEVSISSARGESNMVTMQGNVRKRKMLDEIAIEAEKVPVIEIGTPESGQRMMADEVAYMPGNSVDAIVATVGGIGYNDSEMGEQVEEPKLRTNLNTLAFFVADLRTDATGTATYRFRIPDLLTRWRVRGVAYTNDLKSGNLERTLVTQKPLMVQPNIPRFLRHGDSLVLMAKVILNEELRMKNEELPVEVTFRLTDAATGDVLTLQYQKVKVKDAAQVTCAFRVPKDVYVVTYEVTAATKDGVLAEGRYSDGERGQIPVVSSRQAVTLSQPLYINGKGEKTFHFPLSTFHSSTTAEPHLLAAELTTNPMWLAVKSMPYLKEQENPSTLYLANSLYVNTLANKILEKLDIIEMLGKLADTANTRLKINEDVKQTLLEATPWLRDAEAEVEQRQAIANYFDSARLSEEFSKLNAQLASRQNSDGGWSWMPEGESSTWVTMQVLKRLSILKQSNNQAIKQSLSYVDREEQRHYEKYIKPYLKKYKWEPDNIDYLYTRSYYGKGTTEAYKFYYKNALNNYRKYNGLYTQAQLALIFQRHGDKKAARDLIRRLKEKCLVNDEMGMYWRDNRSGWCWYERPIETQALLIQAFREVVPQDTLSIALMQQWLLKQKQATHWGNDRATVEAISALVMASTNVTSTASPTSLEALKSTTMTLCGIDLSVPSEGLEGYRSQRWEGPALDSIIALGDSTITIRKNTSGIAWGSVYFQYTDDMDKIPSSESGITLKRTYIHEGPWKVGDRVKVRIDISVDRNMEYLELIDGRPSCVEPLSTRSGWNWNQGLRYYVEVKNTATHCYINRLEKGKYVVEYEVYVTNPGTFLAGPVTMQCMYAPEFRATAPAQRLKVN